MKGLLILAIVVCFILLVIGLAMKFAEWRRRRAARRWEIESHDYRDGSGYIGLRRESGRDVVPIADIAAGLDPMERQAEWRIAQDEAKRQLKDLNR